MLVWLTNNGIGSLKYNSHTRWCPALAVCCPPWPLNRQARYCCIAARRAGSVQLSQCAAHHDRSSVRQGIVVFDGFDRMLCRSPEGGWCPALAVCCPPWPIKLQQWHCRVHLHRSVQHWASCAQLPTEPRKLVAQFWSSTQPLTSWPLFGKKPTICNKPLREASCDLCLAISWV